MKEIYNTPSELITQLIDGEISAQQNEQLFVALSVDKDLRQELQEHIAIRESVRNDIEAFTPPIAATNAIFAKLGYATPNGINDNKPKVIPLWSNWMSKAVAPAVLAVFAIFGIANYTDLFVNSNIDNNIGDVNTTSNIVQSNANTAKISVENSSENKQNTIHTSSKNIAKIYSSSNDVIIASKINNDESLATITNSINSENSAISNDDEIITNYHRADLIENSSAYINNYSLYCKQENNFSMFNMPQNNLFSNSVVNNRGSIYLKGFSDLSTGNSIFSSGNSNDFVNLTFGFMMPYKNNISIGLETGIHSFMQYRTDDNNLISKTQEESSVFWITANCRYDIIDIDLFNINPYTQISAGGSTMGFIARSAIGLQYQPEYSSFGFNVGFEYSNIWYSLSPDNAEKVNFTTSNSGIVAGFSYKF